MKVNYIEFFLFTFLIACGPDKEELEKSKNSEKKISQQSTYDKTDLEPAYVLGYKLGNVFISEFDYKVDENFNKYCNIKAENKSNKIMSNVLIYNQNFSDNLNPGQSKIVKVNGIEGGKNLMLEKVRYSDGTFASRESTFQ